MLPVCFSYAQNQKLKNLSSIQSLDAGGCNRLLEEGLYEVYDFKRTNSFSKDFKEYLESEKFRSDFRSGDWSGGVHVSFAGVGLGLTGSESDAEVIEFQEKIREWTTIETTASFYTETASRIPNIELARQFVNCYTATPYGFKISADISEKSGVIKVRFIKESGTKDPIVESLMVSGMTLTQTVLKPGYKMKSSEYAIGFQRIPNEEISFVMETTRGNAIYRHPGTDNEVSTLLPLGTIISSFLPFETFRESIGEKGSWNTTRKWAPCDGRNIVGSKLYQVSAVPTAPDLRGQFLRGLNSFDKNPHATVPVARLENIDPDNRIVGRPQMDAFQGHHHHMGGRLSTQDNPNDQPVILGAGDTPGGEEPRYEIFNSYNYVKHPISDRKNGSPRISTETRPKNVAVYYYIKIN